VGRKCGWERRIVLEYVTTERGTGMNHLDIVDILLVEDNPRDADLTIRALKRRNLANQLTVVEDGAQALDFLFCQGIYESRAAFHSPKVILLDLKLPKVDGLEVLAQIKKNERTKSIPVVILTSSREDPDIKAAYELGANSYVVKPVDFDDFLEAMSHIGFYWLLVNQHSN
jgi:two-component system, response regulator